MTSCRPAPAPIRHVVHTGRPRHSGHYVLSHKTHVTAGHHAATGHPGAHLPVVRHPRPAAHHAPVAPPDSGACGVSDITRKLHANGATGLVGPLSGAPASGLAVGGLAIGGTMVGIGGAAVLAAALLALMLIRWTIARR